MNAIIITVRTGSRRLPQKCLRKIGDKMVIEHIIERAKRSKKANLVLLCTTHLPEDNILCEIAIKNKVFAFRGSAEDKLDRWNEATKRYKIDFFVTHDADDLFCEPELIDLAFEQSLNGADFIEAKNVPCGAFTYGIRVSALRKVCDIKNTYETEMMVPYFTETGLFKVEQLENVPEELQRDMRMTLDYEDDLKFFTNVFENFNGKEFNLRDVIFYLDENPEVVNINSYLQEKYLANQKRLTKVVLK